MSAPTIKTPRLVLRAFRNDDDRALHEIYSQEGVLRYFPNPQPPPLEKIREIIAGQLAHWGKHGLGWWAVETIEGRELIGWNGLQYLPDTGETEVAGLLGRAYWGKGLAVEAAVEGLRYAFETLGLEAVIGLAHPKNARSLRVLEKLGMSFTNQAEYFGMTVARYIIDAPSYERRYL
jgi:ribosomal-protein-alanine N-acetyltransferase